MPCHPMILGDTRSLLAVKLKQSGKVIDPTDLVAQFHMVADDGTEVVAWTAANVTKVTFPANADGTIDNGLQYDFQAADVDTAGTFWVWFRVGDPKTGTITDAVQANPVVITSAGHGLVTGDIITITGIAGMVELNGRTFTVTKIDNDTFSLNGEDGTGHTNYISGGTWTSSTTADEWTTFPAEGRDFEIVITDTV